MICKKKKAGRRDWASLKIGDVGIFLLPNKNAVESARVAVSHLRKLGMSFERIETGEAFAIGYKRTK